MIKYVPSLRLTRIIKYQTYDSLRILLVYLLIYSLSLLK